MSGPVLAILMPTVEGRRWELLAAEVGRQCEGAGAVVLLTQHDRGEATSGIKRQLLCEKADALGAEYTCFLDDDDGIAENYVSRLLEGCNSRADVISFRLQLTRADRPSARPEVWRFGLHDNDRRHGLMCVNHLCAWRRDIARRVAWCPALGCGDDHLWFQPLYHAGLIRTHWHTEDVLYHYLFSPAVTINQRADRVARGRKYVGDGLACFRTPDGEILVQDGHDAPAGHVRVRDRHNVTRLMSIDDELIGSRYHTIVVNR